ncbi:MAG: recombinase family protein [Pseudonocardiaceae bacterium]
MTGTRVGYARCSTDEQDVTVQAEQLQALGVALDRIYIDRGFSGTTRNNRAVQPPSQRGGFPTQLGEHGR